MSVFKLERNEAIYDLRSRARNKYSYNRLGRIFNLSKITIRNILIVTEMHKKANKLANKKG